MANNQKVDNNLVDSYIVETEDQGSGVHRQVIKVAEISGTVSLPTGAATAALQTSGNALLTTIDADTSALAAVDYATSAKQDTGNTSLATIAGDTTSIDGKITACNTGAVVISSGTVTTITNDVNIADGGNSITVDGPGIDIPTVVGNGQKTVASAGTAEALGSSTAIESITIKALSTNTGFIYVGDSGVDSSNGFVLEASETVSLDITNLATIYIDSSVNGEGASFLYVT